MHRFLIQFLLLLLSGIQLHFEGRAKSHWEVRQGRSKTDYRAGENYITEDITLFGTGGHAYLKLQYHHSP